GSRDIFFLASRDGGRTWEKHIDVAPTPGRSTHPAICTGEGFIAIVWRDITGDEASPDIWATVSSDHGKSFIETKDVSNTLQDSKCADVVISHGQVHAIWEEHEMGFHHLKLTSWPLRTH